MTSKGRNPAQYCPLKRAKCHIYEEEELADTNLWCLLSKFTLQALQLAWLQADHASALSWVHGHLGNLPNRRVRAHTKSVPASSVASPVHCVPPAKEDGVKQEPLRVSSLPIPSPTW